MNHITIELSAEDRARLDRIADLLERQITPTIAEAKTETIPEQMTVDTVPAETPTASAQEYTEAQTPQTLPNTPPEEETPTAQADAAPWDPIESFAQHTEHPKPEKAKPTVTLAQIQQKVIQLAAGFGGSKKAAVREIVNAYVKKVSDLPEDKWTEVWDKLTALESEG